MERSVPPATCWRWVRHASALHEDAWRERLSTAAAALAITVKPGARLLRLEVYGPSAGPLRKYVREFGGVVERVDCARIVARANRPRRPVRISRDLVVLDPGARLPASGPRPGIVLRVGAAMAFGTGEHATTASCLRLLLALAPDLPGRWTALDAGTGSGILAIAAEKLGAARVTAFDNDAAAVRAAAANARRNGCARISFSTRDLLRGRAPGRRHDLVLANVYSAVLVAAARRLAGAVAPGGHLIVSGILGPQADATLRALTAQGLLGTRTLRRGRWVTALLRRAADP